MPRLSRLLAALSGVLIASTSFAGAADRFMFRPPGLAAVLDPSGAVDNPPDGGGSETPVAFAPTATFADIDHDKSMPLVIPRPKLSDNRGTRSFTITGLPPLFTYDAATGEIISPSASGGDLQAGVYNVTVKLDATYQGVQSSTTSTFKMTIRETPQAGLSVYQSALDLKLGSDYVQTAKPVVTGLWKDSEEGKAYQGSTSTKIDVTYSGLPGNIALPPFMPGGNNDLYGYLQGYTGAVSGTFTATVTVKETVLANNTNGGSHTIKTNTVSKQFPVVVSESPDYSARLYRLTVKPGFGYYQHADSIVFYSGPAGTGSALPIQSITSPQISGSLQPLATGPRTPEKVMLCETAACDTMLSNPIEFYISFAAPVVPRSVYMYSYGNDSNRHFFAEAANVAGNNLKLEKSLDGVVWTEVSTGKAGASDGVRDGNGYRLSRAAFSMP